METQLLSDQDILPTKEVLANALGERTIVFEELIEKITNTQMGLVPEWNYYKDGKAWLCKVCYKKKTIFWLSVWDDCFKIGFYFTEKNCNEIAALDIAAPIKEEFSRSKTVGKLIPLVIKMTGKEQIEDVMKIIGYKKGLK